MFSGVSADPESMEERYQPLLAGAALASGERDATSERSARARRGQVSANPIWLLTGLITVAATVAAGVAMRAEGGTSFSPTTWIALAVGFAAAEVLVVHMHFERDTHSFSLLEVPLVLGFFLASPLMVITAQATGAAVALSAHRRQPLIKLAFNVTSLSLEAALGVLVFKAFGSGLAPHEPLRIFGTFIAASTASATGVSLVFCANALSERRLHRAALGLPLAFGFTTTIFTASLGVAAVLLIGVSPMAVLLLAVPTAGVYIATRAYTHERQRHQGLEFLYESAKALNRARKIEPALMDTLGRAREALRTDLAEVYLVSGEPLEVLRSSIGPGDTAFAFEAADIREIAEAWAKISIRHTAAVVPDGEAESEIQRYVSGRHLSDAIVAPLRGEERPLGFLVLADRRTDVGRYTHDDVRLVEILANQLAVALENSELERSLEQLIVLKDELARQVYHDPLTGLANRKLFTDRVTGAFERGDRSTPLAVMFIDLDDFKAINDSLGHAAGDELLVAVSRRLKGCVRGNDLVARLGGDEFAVLLEDAGTAADPLNVASRVLAALSMPVTVMGREVTVRASVGVSTSSHATDSERIQQNADVAMYAAKARGKNAVAMFEPALLEAAVERYTISADLEDALREGHLFAVFQPIVDVRSKMVVGVETLVRWDHPTRGMMFPTAFIAVAEESSQITRIREVIVQETLDFLADAAFCGLFAAVNLSGRDIEERGFVPELLEKASRASIPLERLVFEVSEAAVFHEGGIGTSNLARLRDAGATIALDDFGTGHASLGQLRRLPVDTIKLAKVFVDEVDRDDDARAVAEAIITLGHILGKRVIAEGVERSAQLDMLVALGIDMGQGFLLGRPMTAEELRAWLATDEVRRFEPAA